MTVWSTIKFDQSRQSSIHVGGLLILGPRVSSVTVEQLLFEGIVRAQLAEQGWLDQIITASGPILPRDRGIPLDYLVSCVAFPLDVLCVVEGE